MKAALVFVVFAVVTFQIAFSSSSSSSLDEVEVYGVSAAVEPASNSSLVNPSEMDDWEQSGDGQIKHKRKSNNNNNNINININIFCKNKSMDGDHEEEEDDKKSMDHEHKDEKEQDDKTMDGFKRGAMALRGVWQLKKLLVHYCKRSGGSRGASEQKGEDDWSQELKRRGLPGSSQEAAQPGWAETDQEENERDLHKKEHSREMDSLPQNNVIFTWSCGSVAHHPDESDARMRGAKHEGASSGGLGGGTYVDKKFLDLLIRKIGCLENIIRWWLGSLGKSSFNGTGVKLFELLWKLFDGQLGCIEGHGEKYYEEIHP
ncbi:hypothetical protein SELMODRAFT_421721 [Selaginella moellendorffii]|uniref:Uncharacterized protein n=1 Tax=Selaginella moellendorffii TaxID=88036 RepID=D8SG59_SELML|nr:hypothetical protein SELMODRAFT_421721 [Selaginella moellendorffii]